MVRVGLIGFGLAGQAFHAPVIRGVQGMELACILERHGSNAQRRVSRSAHRAQPRRNALRQDASTSCVVATPNDSHYSYTKACLEAGRDVVVDKPLTPTMAEAEELVRLAGEPRPPCHRLSGPPLGRCISYGEETGEIGQLLAAVAEYEARFDRFRLDPSLAPGARRPTIPAAGVLWDLGPHLIDGALVLFGEPETIWAVRLLPARRPRRSTMPST